MFGALQINLIMAFKQQIRINFQTIIINPHINNCCYQMKYGGFKQDK